MNEPDALQALAALAHVTRLGILRLLIQQGPEGLPAGDIALRLGVLQNTLSAHLRILHQAHLVVNTREGRVIRYRADHAAITLNKHLARRAHFIRRTADDGGDN